VRRLSAIALLVLLALGALAGAASAAETWRSQQAAGPQGDFPLLGEVGDIECWNGEANRCVLITAGNAGVPAGIFAYDGAGWYRYATVCGGHEGRIAWAGPTEFWTISDQQAGQASTKDPPPKVSLCHFKDGQVVASYGEPTGAVTSYRQMHAAACAGPSNCWFGGERLPATGVNQGAFHLRWNGASIVAVPSSAEAEELSDPGRTVTGLIHHDGEFYESVEVAGDDLPSLEEEEAGLGPSLVHRIDPLAPTPFKPLFGTEPFGFNATELQGFQLTGADGEDLWAIAGSAGFAPVAFLRLGEGGLSQLLPEDLAGVLGAEVAVASVAAEPGADSAWLAIRPASDGSLISPPARLVEVHGDGTVDAEVALPLVGDELGGEQIGPKGSSGALACTAPEQCWMATRKGWLFHLGPDPAKQSDPALHVLITSRPRDNSLPTVPPIELPEDDSGDKEGGSSDQEPVGEDPFEVPKPKPALLYKIKQRMIGASTLELSFSLRAKARVQLIAKHRRSVVAKTPKQVMAKGRHALRVKLDPDRWPTDVDLDAKAIERKGKGR